LAIAATPRLPAHAYSLARLQVADRGANRFHGAHYFVAGNERKFADLPIVVDQVQIAAANAAMADTNLHLVGAQLSNFIPVCKQFGPGSMCCIASDL
jgi:hypothetical protein